MRLDTPADTSRRRLPPARTRSTLDTDSLDVIAVFVGHCAAQRAPPRHLQIDARFSSAASSIRRPCWTSFGVGDVTARPIANGSSACPDSTWHSPS